MSLEQRQIQIEKAIERWNNLDAKKVPADWTKLSLVGCKLESIDKENHSVLFSLQTQQHMANVMNNVHGGCTATIIDVISTQALMIFDEHYPRASVSVNLNIAYQRAIPIDVKIFIQSSYTKVGKTLAFLECTLSANDPRQCCNPSQLKIFATGTHTKYIYPKAAL
mmetsp:Transcript_8448/g.12858  ORF Transcript_8448/g.12858 Transcript_8448/m.12858 type:complete len:166 (-) Transcript_8448:47-544(-)